MSGTCNEGSIVEKILSMGDSLKYTDTLAQRFAVHKKKKKKVTTKGEDAQAPTERQTRRERENKSYLRIEK